VFNSKNGAILKKLWTHEVLLSGLFSVKKLGLDGTDGKVRSRLDETVCAALVYGIRGACMAPPQSSTNF